jgi:pimeloyl-ACP methyl ester carboxylesterase
LSLVSVLEILRVVIGVAEGDPTARGHLGWSIRESGREDADHTVLLIPGALASASFYDDLLAQETLADASIRFLATTTPGFGGTPAPADLSVEAYARQAGALARELACDAVVGHSNGANIALEMVAAGEFSGPVVLLSPSFSRADESRFPRALDRLSGVFGHLPYSFMLKLIGPAMKRGLPPPRRDVPIAELRNNDPWFLRRHTRSYLEYLDRHGSLARRLCDSGACAWVVFGEHDDVGLTDDERVVLEECPGATLVTIPDTGHFALNQQPAQIAEIVLGALSGTSHG